jgi:hypothetical protein
MADDSNSNIFSRILSLGFVEADHARMAVLAAKSNEGTLTPDERRELESYVSCGDLLATLKSRARLLLRKNPPAA